MESHTLKALREQHGESQTQLALALGTQPHRIAEWENGTYPISPVYKRLLKKHYASKAPKPS